MNLDELKKEAEKTLENVRGGVREELEEAKSRLPWKKMLVALGIMILAGLAIRGLVY